ncbi:hypothetical protein [Sporosarcina sp. FSL K6-3457]
MMITTMNGKRINKLVDKNKTELPTYYSGDIWLMETVLATP